MMISLSLGVCVCACVRVFQYTVPVVYCKHDSLDDQYHLGQGQFPGLLQEGVMCVLKQHRSREDMGWKVKQQQRLFKNE